MLFIERGIGEGCGTIRKPFESRSIGDDALRRLIRRFCRAWYVGEVRRRDGSDFCIDIREQLATADDLRLKLHDDRALALRIGPNRVDDAKHKTDRFFDLLQSLAFGRRYADGEISHALGELIANDA